MKRYNYNYNDVQDFFDGAELARICELSEDRFARRYELETVKVDQRAPHDFYAFRDNGQNILAVGHLDTVAKHTDRKCNIVETQAGPVVFSRGLDDRLGVYTILDLLPKLGIETDILLTTGEENGMSTASFFEPPKQYDWIIEFDRGGSDVVMYQYEDNDARMLVKDSGADVGVGSFSDICVLEHLGVKAFNWGIGYKDYHGPRAHAFLNDTFDMVDCFRDFYVANVGRYMPHEPMKYADDDPTWWIDKDGVYHESYPSRSDAYPDIFGHDFGPVSTEIGARRGNRRKAYKNWWDDVEGGWDND